jgi:hypoxanthine phosphoribosyltransferase
MTVLPVGTRRRMMRNPRGWIAAGFGAGFSPIAPGTVGSIVAILPWWLWMHDLAPRDYAAVLTDQDLLLVTVLKGAVMFVTDLARAIPLPTQLEFMAVSSYGSSTSSSGVVRILKDLDRDIAGRDVLIVEDIVDSGLTLSWLLRNLATRGPKSLRVCTLLRKPDAVRTDVDIAYVGFDIPNEFVVGYGLDYAERYRDLPYIGTLEPKVYEPA